jgi:tetratricopeptide (TPR) repeat protein
MKLSFFKKRSPEDAFQETLHKYQRAVADNPNDIRVHVKIAELYLEHNKKKEAIDEYILAARAYQEKRLLQIAVAIYTHALSIANDRVELYTELANLHLRNGFVGDGVSVLERLAEYYHSSGHEYEATQVLQKIKEIDPDNDFFKQKIEKFLTKKDLDAEKTLRAGPRDKWHLTDHGSSNIVKNIQLGNEGFFDLQGALTDDDDMDFSFNENGDQPSDAEDLRPDEVFKQLKTIMETHPDQDTPAFHYNLGLAYQRCNQIDQAIHEYSLALEGLPQKVECCKRLIDCYLQIKKYELAQQALEIALMVEGISDQEKLDLVYQSGLIYKYSGDYKKALKVFKKIYSINQNYRSVAMEIKQLTTR